MIRSIFTRDGHPGPTDPAVPEAIIAAEMKFGDIDSDRHLSRHGGEPADRRSEEGAVAGADAARRSGTATRPTTDLLEFYTQLPNGDRQFVILPETAHSPGYGKNRHLLWYAIKNFLAAPAPIAAS